MCLGNIKLIFILLKNGFMNKGQHKYSMYFLIFNFPFYHISKLKRNVILRKLQKAKKLQAANAMADA